MNNNSDLTTMGSNPHYLIYLHDNYAVNINKINKTI
jgi:hypothetical protein